MTVSTYPEVPSRAAADIQDLSGVDHLPTSSTELLDVPPTLSIIIPAHNEQHNIEPLLWEIHEVLSQLPDAEIIFVDDGSTDQTLSELRRMKRESIPELRIIQHTKSTGQSAAILSGVRAARGHLIVTLDADGQNPPSDIPSMVALAQAQPAGTHFCIAGHRFERQDTRWKKLQSRVANAVRQSILRDGTPDTGCALKVIPRDTWLQLPCFNHMHRFLPALIQHAGGDVVVQKVSHRSRQYDESKYAMRNRVGAGLIDMVGVLWLGYRTRVTQVRELSDEQD